MVQLGISLTDGHTFEELDFKDVYVTTDIINPGLGSSETSFSSMLDMGLRFCVPELGVIYSGSPGVASPIRNLGEYWYETDLDLTEQEFNLVAKLTALFASIISSDSREFLPMHIFAWFLAITEQGPELPRLGEWLEEHAKRLSNSFQVTDLTQPIVLKEVVRFNALYSIVSKWCVRLDHTKNLIFNVSKSKANAKAQHCRKKRKEIIAERRRKQEEWLASQRRKREEEGKASIVEEDEKQVQMCGMFSLDVPDQHDVDIAAGESDLGGSGDDEMNVTTD